MKLINEPVHHHQYGSGTITDQTMTRVTVEFCEDHGRKMFQYPYVFETFLELINPDVNQKMHEELRALHEREELERQLHTEELERNQGEKRRILQEEKRAAARKQTSSKSKASKTK